mmetsp:Transcript_24662/g.49040  ORF Transcript_24662/g.49040 Transcript_24662/m.49040 type:complete len:142 (+) Transcript_24662:168-593(+)
MPLHPSTTFTVGSGAVKASDESKESGRVRGSGISVDVGCAPTLALISWKESVNESRDARYDRMLDMRMERYEGGRKEQSLDRDGACTRSTDSFSDSSRRQSGGGDVLLIKINSANVRGVGAMGEGAIRGVNCNRGVGGVRF